VLLAASFLTGERATRSYSADLAVKLRGAGWKVLMTSSVPGRALRALDIARTIWRRRHDFDVAHVEVYSGAAFLWAELACLALRWAAKPYILSLRGGNLPGFAQRYPRRVKRMLRSAQAVIVPSGYLHEQMRPYRQDLTLVPNSLDVQAYPFRPRAQAKASLIWMRAFHGIYNPTLAARTLALLEREFPDVRLQMIGPDMRDGSLGATARISAEMGVAHRVHIHGPVPKGEVGQWLNRADIFLNTPTVDNTPVTVLEALACGLCVVSTNVGGLRHLLRHEYDALLAPGGDAESIAAAVRRVLLEPPLAQQLSRNGRKTAEQFAWSRTLPMWDQVLRTAARAGGA